MEEVRRRSNNMNARYAKLRVNVRNLEDNKMWVSNYGRTSCSSSSSYDVPTPKRHPTKLPMSTHEESEKSWWKDPELKRKCRVAKYKFYAAEGRFKCSLKSGIRWLKFRCINIIRTTHAS